MIHWMPIITTALLAVTFAITYAVAVSLKHVYPFWPFISDTGTLPPESCIFSQLMNLVCLLLSCTIYIRHRQVEELLKANPIVKISRRWNIFCCITGHLSCLGLNIVANYQETSCFVMHIIGAFTCFVCGIVYFTLQCIFTYRLDNVPKRIFWYRVLFVCCNVIFFISSIAPLGEALKKFKGKNFLQWSPRDGGYSYHLTCTISEWLLVLSFCLFVCTFHSEFRRIKITPSVLTLRDTPQDEVEKRTQGQCKPVPGMSQWI